MKNVIVAALMTVAIFSTNAGAQFKDPDNATKDFVINIKDGNIGAIDSSHSISMNPIQLGYSKMDSTILFFLCEDSVKAYITFERVWSSGVIDTVSIQIISVGPGVVPITYASLVKTLGSGLNLWPAIKVRRVLITPGSTCMASKGKKLAMYHENFYN